MSIGFLGVGQMGAAIVRRLLDGGVAVHVFDPNASAVERIVHHGAIAEATVEAVAESAEIVFACLGSIEASNAVADILSAAPGRARIFVELSTVGRASVQRTAELLYKRGIATVDCPVSGGPSAAAAGRLAIMPAAPRTVLAEMHPIFERFAGSIFEVGDKPGQGQMMKLVNNVIAISNLTIASEALVLGAKGGLDPSMMVDVINHSTGRSSITEHNVPKSILPGTFDYGGRLALPYKDLVLALEEAEASGVTMWTTDTVRQIWRFALGQGRGEQDFTSIIKVMEEWAGVEVRSAAAAQPVSAP